MQWARVGTRDVHALYLAVGDPHVPRYAKVVAVAIAAYASSPIDLIPDFMALQCFRISSDGIAVVVKRMNHQERSASR